MTNGSVTAFDLTRLCKVMLGSSFELSRSEQIFGGIAKTTFRVHGRHAAEQYIVQVWKEPHGELTSLDTSASRLLWPGGSEVFEANTNSLLSHGVRVPRIVASCRDRLVCPYHVAILEFVDAPALENIGSRAHSANTHRQVGRALGALHSITREQPGSLLASGQVQALDCQAVCLQVAKEDLCIARLYDEYVRFQEERIEETLEAMLLTRGAAPRNFVHGDLGGQHILVGEEVWFIDVEGAQFFDLEWEYCVLGLPMMDLLSEEFLDAYRSCCTTELSDTKLRFYRICKLLDWVTTFAECVAKGVGDVGTARTRLRNTKEWLKQELAAGQGRSTPINASCP
jgi:hypothetical protein